MDMDDGKLAQAKKRDSSREIYVVKGEHIESLVNSYANALKEIWKTREVIRELLEARKEKSNILEREWKKRTRRCLLGQPQIL
jgi:hypothetical protein